MDKFHNQKLPHLIYAILWEDDGDEFAFVGKTTTADTKALLRRHLRGEVSLTAQDLKRDDWEGKPPRLVVLQSLLCTGAEAYRYILCFHRLYEDFGFMTVAHRGTDNQAYDMHPYTDHLYAQFQKTVTRDFLLTGIAMSEKETEKPVRKQKKELTSQLNMRLELSTLGAFQCFCSNLGLTQKEGFLHLLKHIDQDGLAADPLFVEQRKIIERQKRRIDELEAKLQKESRGQKADAKLKNTLTNIKRLIAQYITKVAEKPEGVPLRRPRQKPNAIFHTYVYPQVDGAVILELRDLYYSKGEYRALFLCGVDVVSGAAIKLRYYPKENYIGCTPGGEYCVEDARWLISYQRAADGAMDLTVALPLPLWWDEGDAEKPKKAEKQKWLDETIQEIEQLRWG